MKCDKCGGSNITATTPAQTEQAEITMDSLVKQSQEGIPSVYYHTIYRCRNCGYSVFV